jgi:hypothetical protein
MLDDVNIVYLAPNLCIDIADLPSSTAVHGHTKLRSDCAVCRADTANRWQAKKSKHGDKHHNAWDYPLQQMPECAEALINVFAIGVPLAI